MIWASKSCNVILNNNSADKNLNTQQAHFFSFLKKTKPIKQKKVINISYLIIVIIKMRLLIFLILCRSGLACKYITISQISIYNWMQNCIFRYLWNCIFIFLGSNYNLMRQVRWLSHDELRALSSIQIAILLRTSSGRQLN